MQTGKLAIVCCATKSYTYALKSMLRALSNNIAQVRKNESLKDLDIHIFLVGDGTLKDFESLLERMEAGSR